jgi:23S rRNA (uracil1939-C5)-methyltransferase
LITGNPNAPERCMKRPDRSSRTAGGVPLAGVIAPEVQIEIAEMGARGDAVANGEDGPIFAPYALPGETVRAVVMAGRADVRGIERASPERVEPPCAHFGRCGGCQLQHWAEAPYLAWKRDEVIRSLARRGLECEVAPIIAAWGEGRRRAAFHAQRVGRVVRFGFIERGGARIESLDACPALAPALSAALPKLYTLGEAFAPSRGEIVLQCLATETGLDIAIKGAGKPSQFDRTRLETTASLAERLDIARLSFDGEPLVERRAPILTMGPARVSPPPGAFFQATAEGERILGALVVSALSGADRVADLFSGVGTFALRMAPFAETHAVEGDGDMLAALKRAADAIGGLRGVSIERRDLLRAPLSALELKRFDSVVFDPPRSGAKLQAEQIGRSKAQRVAAVSCDPATFARDVRVLIDAGFKLRSVTPVDQFRWTPHVEIVGLLER